MVKTKSCFLWFFTFLFFISCNATKTLSNISEEIEFSETKIEVLLKEDVTPRTVLKEFIDYDLTLDKQSGDYLVFKFEKDWDEEEILHEIQKSKNVINASFARK